MTINKKHTIMKKTWNYNGRNYEMIKTGYGQYTLNGYHCTDSSIWDWCDDDEDEDKYMAALDAAERFVQQHQEEISSLEEFADYINAEGEWKLSMEAIIEQNGWVSDCGEEYGICHDGNEYLEFNADGKAVVISR